MLRKFLVDTDPYFHVLTVYLKNCVKTSITIQTYQLAPTVTLSLSSLLYPHGAEVRASMILLRQDALRKTGSVTQLVQNRTTIPLTSKARLLSILSSIVQRYGPALLPSGL
jgi:hypothetical protein